MLASLKGSLVPTKNSLPQYCHRYLANTYINKQGCFHLSQAHWRELAYLRLGKNKDNAGGNNIEDWGCKYLAIA